MKELIVNSLEIVSKVAIVAMVGGAFLGGFAFSGFWAGLVSALGAFIGAVTIFGGLFVLLEMNDHLRVLRRYVERKDPSLTPVAPSLERKI